MSDIHIDDFYRDTAKILLALYISFPRKTSLYVEDISGPDEPDEFGLHSTRHESCLHTMMWLASAGYLQYEQLIRQEALENAVLTHRGFLTLSSRLEISDGAAEKTQIDGQFEIALVQEKEKTVINQIRGELKDGSSFSLANLIQDVMKLSRTHE